MRCEPYCREPCSSLTGDVLSLECGGCDSSVACHPGAADYESWFFRADRRDLFSPITPTTMPDHLLSSPSTSDAERLASDDTCSSIGVAPTTPIEPIGQLLFANSGGTMRALIFNCHTESAVSGEVHEVDGHWRAVLRRSSTGWAYRPHARSCRLLAPRVAARLDRLCAAKAQPGVFRAEAAQERCDEPEEIDWECRQRRHVAAFGAHLLPHCSSSALDGITGMPSSPKCEDEEQDEGHQSLAINDLAEAAQKTSNATVVRGGMVTVFEGCPSLDLFLRDHVYASRPLVLRGCATDMPAIQGWSDTYLSEVAGTWMGNARLAKAGLDLSSFLERSARGEELFYTPFNAVPHTLRRDLKLPPMLRCTSLLEADLIRSIHLRISDRRRHINGLHFDAGAFLSVQIDGVKRWSLVDPVHSLHLYPDHVYPRGGASHGVSVFTNGAALPLHALPRLDHVPVWRATIRAGDILFVPKFWWHEIDNLPGRNLAAQINLQFPDPPRFEERLRARGVDRTSYAAHDLVNLGLHLRTLPTRRVRKAKLHLHTALRSCFAPQQAVVWREELLHAAFNRTDGMPASGARDAQPARECVAF